LFADGDETYDLIVLLAGTADIVEGYGHPEASVVASYGPSEFLGEMRHLRGAGPRSSGGAGTPGHGAGARSERPHLADVPAASLHPDEPRHRPDPDRIAFRPDTRRLLEVLARNPLVW